MKHDYYTTKDCPNCNPFIFNIPNHCNICDGGLAICKVCKLAEGELTTDCPGEPNQQYGKDTYDNLIDFKDGEWIHVQTGLMMIQPEKKNKFSLIEWLES